MLSDQLTQLMEQNQEVRLLDKVNIYFISDDRTATLPQPQDCGPEDSFCSILAMAGHLNYDLEVPLPILQGPLLRKKSTLSGFRFGPNGRPDFIEVWSDLLFETLSKGQATEYHGTVYLAVKVEETFIDILQLSEECGFVISDHDYETKEEAAQHLDAFIGKPQSLRPKKTKKIAFINFSTSILNNDIIKPRIHLEGLLSGIFYNDGEQWKSYRILAGDIPTPEELVGYDTIILGGSSHSVNNMPPRILAFRAVLKQAIEMSGKLKVMGICFGHQFIAHIKDAKIGTRKLTKGPFTLNFQLEDEQINEADAPQFLHTEEFEQLKKVRIYKYHSDFVSEVPEGFSRFGTSDNLEIEGLISHDFRFMSFQSHPEYTHEYIRKFEKRLSYYTGRLDRFHSFEEDQEHHRTIQIFRTAMRRFLNWQP